MDENQKTETILLAEDYSIVRLAVKAICEKAGYTIIEAIDGEDAVLKFKQNSSRIDLFVSDIVMPRRNGKTAYDEMLKINPHLKAIFMSNHTEEIINDKLLFSEKINFIEKPFSSAVLLKKIRRALNTNMAHGATTRLCPHIQNPPDANCYCVKLTSLCIEKTVYYCGNYYYECEIYQTFSAKI